VNIDLCEDEKLAQEGIAIAKRQTSFILKHYRRNAPLKMKFVKEQLKLLGVVIMLSVFDLFSFTGVKMDGNHLAPLIARLYNALKNKSDEKKNASDDILIETREDDIVFDKEEAKKGEFILFMLLLLFHEFISLWCRFLF
jgi:hypothetical protein